MFINLIKLANATMGGSPAGGFDSVSSRGPERTAGRMTMSAIAASGLIVAMSAALALSGLSRSAQAEEAYDPEDTVYATGAIFATEEELAGVPRTPLYRAYLPPYVDLRDRFPPAGDQGGQGSCVGWAVGYAARSYYNSPAGGGTRLTAHDVLSVSGLPAGIGA